MTDSDEALDAISHAASELLPQLSERLHRYGLGEIEIARGDLRLRVRGASNSAPLPPVPLQPVASSPPTDGPLSAGHGDPGEPPSVERPPVEVASPAVGFFVYADGLGPGLEVGKGDALGHVEMLGVRHDVRAPRSGTVRNLVAESGEAVEYGQTVIELEMGEGSR